jgi:hypothetical protein
MHILVISPTKGNRVYNAKSVPRIGEAIYHKDHYLKVNEVAWFPPVEVLAKCNATWEGCHVSELEGDAAIEVIIRVD